MITLSVDDQKSATDLMIFMLKKIDPNGKHLTASSMDEVFKILNDSFDIIFLDVEMPGLNGIEGASVLKKKYPKLNIVFVTGHPRYLQQAFSLHPSGFLTKPVCEQDIIDELKELRFPLKSKEIKVQCSPFGIFVDNRPFVFDAAKTTELFAYLIYKNGVYCTNNELCGVLWNDDMGKRSRLRQLVMELRGFFENLFTEDILLKKYGAIGLDTELDPLVSLPLSTVTMQIGLVNKEKRLSETSR